MKQLVVATGGRPFAWDDMLTLQGELTQALQATLQDLGPCVMSGCQVSGPATGATITAGLVLLDGQLLRFPGAAGVGLPAQFQAGAAVASDPRPYQTGGTQNCMSEVPAEVVVANSTYVGGQFLPVDVYGALTYWHRTQDKTRTLSEVQWLASFTAGNYDATGLGLPGTEAWGWQLMPDAAGRFPVVLDPNMPDYDTVGKVGGAAAVSLTADQNGPHTHVIDLTLTDKGGQQSNKTTAMYGQPGAYTSGSAAMEASGSGNAHENRPPFYTLGARQWVGY